MALGTILGQKLFTTRRTGGRGLFNFLGRIRILLANPGLIWFLSLSGKTFRGTLLAPSKKAWLFPLTPRNWHGWKSLGFPNLGGKGTFWVGKTRERFLTLIGCLLQRNGTTAGVFKFSPCFKGFWFPLFKGSFPREGERGFPNQGRDLGLCCGTSLWVGLFCKRLLCGPQGLIVGYLGQVFF